jgi:hypothetical protein
MVSESFARTQKWQTAWSAIFVCPANNGYCEGSTFMAICPGEGNGKGNRAPKKGGIHHKQAGSVIPVPDWLFICRECFLLIREELPGRFI